jgi:hypothetical protein
MAHGIGSIVTSAALRAGLALAAIIVTSAVLAAPDPAKVIGPDECGECHKDEVRIWRETKHYKTFQELPRKDKAREIADKLGLRRIKAESRCLGCHFTTVLDNDGKKDAIAGISCESCHAAAKDWNLPHSDYGGKEVKRENETPEHRRERIAATRAAGMIQPSMRYEWANNCYTCHTVPDERLVNEGGHPPGSKFELVGWLQGEVRHNVWYTEGKSNPEASQEDKRVMLVLGRVLDLEHALRGVAKATKRADYAVAMATRAKTAAQRIKQISEVASTPEIDAILEIAGSIQLKLNNADELTGAADRIAEQARAFAAGNDGSGLAALDALIPGPDLYRGSPVQ